MNAQSATKFDYTSNKNAAIVEASFECDCEAYVDIFTYNRWKAQGFVVRKGEKGTKIETWRVITRENDDGDKVVVGRRPWTSTVFCRHQVQTPDPSHKSKSSNVGKANGRKANVGNTCHVCNGTGKDPRISPEYDQTCYVCSEPPNVERVLPRDNVRSDVQEQVQEQAQEPAVVRNVAHSSTPTVRYTEYAPGPLDNDGKPVIGVHGVPVKGSEVVHFSDLGNDYLKSRKAYKGRGRIKQLPYLKDTYKGKNTAGGRKCQFRQSAEYKRPEASGTFPWGMVRSDETPKFWTIEG